MAPTHIPPRVYPNLTLRTGDAQPSGATPRADPNHFRRTRFLLAAALLALSACDGNNPIGPAASIEISPLSWAPTYLGARQQFTAVARDAGGRVVPGSFTWAVLPDTGTVHALCQSCNVLSIDSAGVATALKVGGAIVRATRAGISGTALVAITTTDDPAAVPPGLMWTVWFARSDSSPALLVNGKLRTPDQFYDEPSHPDSTVWPVADVAKFMWAGDRIGLLTDTVNGAGNFRVHDRVGEWTDLAIGDAVDFELSGNLIGVQTSDGKLLAKDGSLGDWVVLATGGVKEWKMRAGQLIGLMTSDGALRMKDGINGTWSLLVSGGVRKWNMATGGRIGVILDNGEFLVKSGIDAPWTVLADTGAADFALNGDRIALLLSNGTFEVKDGQDGPWTVLVTGGVRQFALAGDRIGVVLPDGTFQVKDGINGGWVTLATAGVKDIRFQGNMIGMVTDDGRLSIKDGTLGTWKTGGPYGGDITQYQLEVDVPVPPVRTTPQSYADSQAACSAEVGGVPCDPYPRAAPSAYGPPYYGRFCGAHRPSKKQWDAATRIGAIDGMDALCHHHDDADIWYPEAHGSQACVVRYGLYFSRLTDNGVLLADGTVSGSAAWDRAFDHTMGYLVEAVNDYTVWVTDDKVCSDNALKDFIKNTAAQ
jgi:hypothetical protein